MWAGVRLISLLTRYGRIVSSNEVCIIFVVR